MTGPIWWEWFKRLLEFWRKQLEPTTTSGAYATMSAADIIADLSALLTNNGIPGDSTKRADLSFILAIVGLAQSLSWNSLDETDAANLSGLVASTQTALNNA